MCPDRRLLYVSIIHLDGSRLYKPMFTSAVVGEYKCLLIAQWCAVVPQQFCFGCKLEYTVYTVYKVEGSIEMILLVRFFAQYFSSLFVT